MTVWAATISIQVQMYKLYRRKQEQRVKTILGHHLVPQVELPRKTGTAERFLETTT